MTDCIHNKANIEYQYNQDGQCMQNTTATGSVFTTITAPHLVVQKIAHSKHFQPCEPICYSIVITNTGDAVARDIAVADRLCHQRYCCGSASLSINGDPAPDCRLQVGNIIREDCGCPQFGFCIGDLCPCETAVITFSAQPDPRQCEITNQATVFYGNGRCRRQQAASNETRLTKSFAKVTAEKCVNKRCAVCGDELVYTIVLTNQGNQPAYNVNVTDQLPEGFCLNQCGVKVNGLNVNYKLSRNNFLTIPCLAIPAQGGGCCDGCGGNNRLIITIAGRLNTTRTNHCCNQHECSEHCCDRHEPSEHCCDQHEPSEHCCNHHKHKHCGNHHERSHDNTNNQQAVPTDANNFEYQQASAATETAAAE